MVAAATTVAAVVDPAAGYAVVDRIEASRVFVNGGVSALAHDRDGMLLVGSSRLSVFDGNSLWNHVEVPGVTRILAIVPEKPAGEAETPERIWICGDGPLGYILKAPSGHWQFHPLPVQPDGAGPTDIRDVKPDRQGGALFVARSKIMRWDGTRISTWELPSALRLFTFVYREDLYVYQTGVGLHMVEADGPKLVLPEAEMPVHVPLVGLYDLGEDAQLAIFFEDAFVRRGKEWSRLTELSEALRGKRAMTTTRLGGDQIAIGTAYGGIVTCQLDGTRATVITGQNGLTDDIVDSIVSDASGGLWIGSSTGLTRLRGANVASLFDERARLATGAICRVLDFAGHPFVVTSRRVYDLQPAVAPAPARFSRVNEIWPQLRDAAVMSDQLWVAGVGGLWRIEENLAVHSTAVTGDVFPLLVPARRPNELVFFEGTAARALNQEDGIWRAVDLGQRVESLPIAAVEDSAGRIWVATRNSHVYVFSWDGTGRTLQVAGHLQPGRGLPSRVQCNLLTSFAGVIFAFTDSKILRCTDLESGFSEVPELAGLVGEATVSASDGTAYWCVQHQLFSRVGLHGLIELKAMPSGGSLHPRFIPVPGMNHIDEIDSIGLTGDPGYPILWIGGDNSLLRTDLAKLGPAGDIPVTNLQPWNVPAGNPAPSSRLASPVVLPAAGGRIEFSFSAGADHADLRYQTRLDDIETEWTPTQRIPRREFTALAPGSYVFWSRAVDVFGRTGYPAQFSFVVEAPWYRRPWALVGWAGAVLALGWLGLKWWVRHLHNQAARLEKLVNDRTRELSLSNTARAEFLDSLSHELRRPLNGIVSLTKRLAASDLTPAQERDAQLLLLGGDKLLQVFQEMLNYSAFECGALRPEDRPFHLRPLLEDVISGGADDGRCPTLHFAPDFEDGFIGDATILKTIVGNFVANTRSHAPGAAVEIAVSGSETSPGFLDVLVDVTDDGPGIPAEEQEVIFKRFVRGSRAKEAKVPGAGLGLATCHALAQVLGGSVGVESPAERVRARAGRGPGTTFFVRVPLRRLQTAAAKIILAADRRSG